MTSARCGAVALLIAFAVPLTHPSSARAEPTSEDLASARALFKEGRALREKGDLPKAIEKLRAAHALGQTPITGLELARTYVLVGKLVDAHEVSLGVARLSVASDETVKSEVARAEAAKLATALEPRLAKLVISVKGAPAGAAPQVIVDGEAIPLAALGEARSADPGSHLVVLTLPPGREVRAQLEVNEGESRDVVLDASAASGPPVAPALPVSPVEEPAVAHAPSSRSPLLLVSGATVAGFGLLFGASFGVATLTAKNSLATDCPGGLCPPPHHAELATAQIDATASTVSFVVAGVGVGAVIVDLLLRAKSEPHPKVEADLGLGWVGVHGAF